jgi:hypothetical protein
VFVQIEKPRAVSPAAGLLKLADALLQQALLYSGPFLRSTEKSPPLRFDFALTGRSTLWDYIGQGELWAGWYPVKPIPLGKRTRREGWTPEPARRAEARKNIKEQHDAIVREQLAMQELPRMATKRFPKVYAGVVGLVATTFKSGRELFGNDGFWLSDAQASDLARQHRPTSLKLAPDVDPALIEVAPQLLVAYVRDDGAAMVQLPLHRHVNRDWLAAKPTPAHTPGPDADPALQDKITALNKRGLSPATILDAVRKEGFEIDLDGVQSAIGPTNTMFGEGRDAPIVDDDKADRTRWATAINARAESVQVVSRAGSSAG